MDLLVLGFGSLHVCGDSRATNFSPESRNGDHLFGGRCVATAALAYLAREWAGVFVATDFTTPCAVAARWGVS